MQNDKGYTHLYTGNGKGKTTAAFGLALRALCAGRSVYVGQFVKSMKYNETAVEKYFDRIRIEQLGSGCYLDRTPDIRDVEMAREGLSRCRAILASGDYDVVILDEITIAVHYGLITSADVIEALKTKAEGTEVVMTGRYATDELVEVSDLVTEMKEIKHYYTRGVLSRDGIDR